MTYRVGPKGQVVIPKAIRDELGIEPGDEVEVSMQDGKVVIDKRAVALRRLEQLRESFADADWAGATDELLAERKRDREREELKLRRMLGEE